MLKYFFLLFVSTLILTACDDTPKRVLPKGKSPIIPDKPFPKDRETPIDIPPPPAPYTGPKKLCFEMELGINANEMTRMEFILDDNDSIRGHLNYTFADRLPIRGSICGLKEGKFIELKYEYVDSAVQKQEQLILKLEGDKLYKKTGPMVEENGVLVLENPLTAQLLLFLIRVDCK